MQNYISITASHHKQGPSTTFNDYFMEAEFYYSMLGLIEDVGVSLANTYYQDSFIAQLQNATAIEEQVHREGTSPDPQDHHKYSNEMFVQHISGIMILFSGFPPNQHNHLTPTNCI